MRDHLTAGYTALNRGIGVRIPVPQQVMERINVARKIIKSSEYIDIVESFLVGEELHGVFPHENEKGEKHTGNMEIIEVGSFGLRAVAKCVMPDCQVTVEVRNKS